MQELRTERKWINKLKRADNEILVSWLSLRNKEMWLYSISKM